jgi:ParB family chromosome partitioning protein
VSDSTALAEREELHIAAGAFRVPAKLDDDGLRRLGALAFVCEGSQWATAAAVYAWTYEAGRGRPPNNAEMSALLTLSEFAKLGLRGLTDRGTVTKYRDAWARAIRKGWAEDVQPGAAAQLPDRPFETAVEMGGTKATTGVEWYTPPEYIDAAREVMGGIDLDPATSDMANETVQAPEIFTAEDDGLAQPWHGRVWLNPPYGKGSGLFTRKLVEEHDAGNVTAAVLLLNAYGFDAEWFKPLWTFPICFTDHRIEFYSPDRDSGGPANGNIFVYLGPDPARFAEVFRAFGSVVRSWP